MQEISDRELADCLNEVSKFDNNNRSTTRVELNHLDFGQKRLIRANFTGVNLTGSRLVRCSIREANFTDAEMALTDFSSSDLARACFRGANLGGANFSNSNLVCADFTGARLENAVFIEANLSRAIGLPTAASFIDKLEKTETGVICYKAIGNTTYEAPKAWSFRKGTYIEEVVNHERTCTCGCGVNVADSIDWCQDQYRHAAFIWKCQIDWIDLADVVVPYGTDGKFRASRVKLIEPVACSGFFLTDDPA